MSPLSVSVDLKMQGGIPSFTGTRVPVSSLFDDIEGGYTIDYFLSQFRRVRRDKEIEVLESAKRLMHQALAPVQGEREIPPPCSSSRAKGKSK